jgi:hypothetical protein
MHASHLFVGEDVTRRVPTTVLDLPGWLGDKGRKGEPIVVSVFLEIGKSDE